MTIDTALVRDGRGAVGDPAHHGHDTGEPAPPPHPPAAWPATRDLPADLADLEARLRSDPGLAAALTADRRLRGTVVATLLDHDATARERFADAETLGAYVAAVLESPRPRPVTSSIAPVAIATRPRIRPSRAPAAATHPSHDRHLR